MDNIKALIETTLKAEIAKALNQAPEAIEKLVQAALSQPVYSNGEIESRGYSPGNKMPYLDWLVGSEIRRATEGAVRDAVAACEPSIKAEVAKRLNAENVVDAFTEQILGTVKEDWRLNVNFTQRER